MDFDLGRRLIELAIEGVKAGHTSQQVFADLLMAGDQAVRHPVWGALAAVSVEADVDSTAAWLEAEFRRNPPPANVSGLWFGLYEVESESPDVGEAVIKVSGGADYPEPDWLFHQDWYAANYAPTPGLRSLNRLAMRAEPDVRWLVNYAVVFGVTLSLVCDLCNGWVGAVLRADKEELAIATGFHDGDILLVGVLQEPGQLDLSKMAWA